MSERDAAPEEGSWEALAEVKDVYEAELIALRLREAGVPARVVDQSFRQEPIPSVRSFAVVRVFVPTVRADEGRRLLSQPPPPLGDVESEEP